MMMNQDKRKTVMLYPATSKDLTLEIGVVCAGVLLPLIICRNQQRCLHFRLLLEDPF